MKSDLVSFTKDLARVERCRPHALALEPKIRAIAQADPMVSISPFLCDTMAIAPLFIAFVIQSFSSASSDSRWIFIRIPQINFQKLVM